MDRRTNLALNYRQIELGGSTIQGNSVYNNSTNNSSVTINTNLLIAGTGARPLALGGGFKHGREHHRRHDRRRAGRTGQPDRTKRLLVLSGHDTYNGTTSVYGGTLAIGNGTKGEYLASPTIADAATLAFNHDNALVYSGSITGAGVLVKQGLGQLTLSGSNTYTGATTISGGLFASPAPSPARRRDDFRGRRAGRHRLRGRRGNGRRGDRHCSRREHQPCRWRAWERFP